MIARRKLLQGVCGFPFVVRAADAVVAELDVAIIGAGPAGIGAGRTLAAAGRQFRIFEARSRPGGRVLTDMSLGQPFDAGATYIHCGTCNPWAAIAPSLQVETIRIPDDTAFHVVGQDGRRLSDEERRDRRASFTRLQEKIEAFKLGEPDVSYAKLAEGEIPAMRQAVRSMTVFNVGEEPERVSVIDLKSQWDGEDLLVPGGYGRLVSRAAEGLPIRYDAAIRELHWDGSGVRLILDDGAVHARFAIVTASVGVLKAGGVRFRPDLPPGILSALDGLAMGALTRIALKFDGARFDFSPFTDIYDVGDPDRLLNAETWAHGRDIVLCFAGGDFARSLIREGETAAVAHVLDRLVAVFGGEARGHFQRGRMVDWVSDPWSRGSFSYARVGSVAARQALSQPVGEKIWLAGEANAGPGAMTAGGATLAGAAAANAILEKSHG
jgi:monoamine oxidase